VKKMAGSSLKSKLPYIILYSIIALVVIGGSLLFVNSYKKYQAEKEAKEKAILEEAKRKQEAEKAKQLALQLKNEEAKAQKKKEAYEKALTYAKENADKPGLVKTYLLRMKKFLAGTEYEAMLEDEIKKVKDRKPEEAKERELSDGAKREMESLARQTRAFVEGHQYMKAAEIYRDYSGFYKKETSKDRQKFVEKYFRMARDYENKMDKADKLLKQAMYSIGQDILRGKYDAAVKKLEDAAKNPDIESRKIDLESAISTIKRLKLVKSALNDSFINDKGRNVTIKLRTGEVQGKILDVKGSSIIILAKAKKGAVKKTISMSSISPTEREKRLSSLGSETIALYKGLTAFRKRKPEKAKEYVSKAGIFSEPMIKAIGDWEVKKMHEYLGN
jgi:hypothetical protein